MKQRVGEYVYGMDVSSLEEVLVKQLIQHNKSIALAESCTGGMAVSYTHLFAIYFTSINIFYCQPN